MGYSAGIASTVPAYRVARNIAVGDIVIDGAACPGAWIAIAGAARRLPLHYPVHRGQRDKLAVTAIMHDLAAEIGDRAVHVAASKAAEQADRLHADAFGLYQPS